MGKKLYERARAAKETVGLRSSTGEWNTVVEDSDNLLTEVQTLYRYVCKLPFDERCVIAAGIFLKRGETWLFKMPSTRKAIQQVVKRYHDNNDAFAVLHAEYWVNNPESDELHVIHIFDRPKKEDVK